MPGAGQFFASPHFKKNRVHAAGMHGAFFALTMTAEWISPVPKEEPYEESLVEKVVRPFQC